MRHLKPLLLFLLILFCAFNIQVRKPYLAKWVITKGCLLRVGGSTNVNKFSCVIANYYQPDTLTLYKGNSIDEVKLAGNIKLDVQNFNCHHPVMTADLRKTLKAKDYPKLIIRFISLSKFPTYNDNGDYLTGIVIIELAGVAKRFNVEYEFTRNSNNAFTLVGARQVKFSDFNIKPPRKIGGMIQTNN
jgi:hypothetical protein